MEREIPEYIELALNNHPTVAEFFNSLSDTERREYVEWVDDPQQKDERQQRLQKMLERLKEGKKGPGD